MNAWQPKREIEEFNYQDILEQVLEVRHGEAVEVSVRLVHLYRVNLGSERCTATVSQQS